MNDISNASAPFNVLIIKLVLYTFKEIAMFEKVKQILVDELQVDESLITLDAELANDLGINSIELADLVMICEDKFDIEISDDNIGQFVTIRDVVNYLETL